MLASAANLAIKSASAVSALGPKFPAICLRNASSLMAACLLASAKTLSVSTFASSTASSTPEPRCCGIAVSDAWAAGDDDDAAVDAAGAAGADDDDAAVDAAWAPGAYDCARPCVGGVSCCVNTCLCVGGCPGAAACPCAGGCPRLGGRAECVRGGPCVDGCGTTGGFANACPWCGPG